MWLYHALQKIKIVEDSLERYMDKRTERIVADVLPYLSKKNSILDIGSGCGHNVHRLKQLGFKKVRSVDVVDMSVYPDAKPIIYNGVKLPFEKDEFEVALLITVLHHTPDPEKILKETSRVAKRIVVVEDTYKNVFQQYVTYVMDSVGNLEFKGHPHTNKTDKGWRKSFKKLGLKVVGTKRHKFLWFFESTTYCVEKK